MDSSIITPQDPVQPSLTPEQKKKKKESHLGLDHVRLGQLSFLLPPSWLPFFPFISLNILCSESAVPIWGLGGRHR